MSAQPNPKEPIEFANYAHLRPALEKQLSDETAEINAGNANKALLIQGMMGNWSVEQYLKVAKYKGKGWHALSPLADKSLEIQGIALLYLVAQVIGNDLTMRTVISAMDAMRFLEKFNKETENDPFAAQILEDAKRDITDHARQTRENYRDWTNRMLK